MAKPLQQQVIARALGLIADEANGSRSAWARNSSGSLVPGFIRLPTVSARSGLNRAAFELVADGGYELAISAARQVAAARGGSMPIFRKSTTQKTMRLSLPCLSARCCSGTVLRRASPLGMWWMISPLVLYSRRVVAPMVMKVPLRPRATARVHKVAGREPCRHGHAATFAPCTKILSHAPST